MLLKNWGFTFLTISVTFITLEVSLKQLEEQGNFLERQLTELKGKIKEGLLRQENLKRQINSQSDPAWVEMVLKKELGLVPEGQIKVYFSNGTSSSL